ncbi:MULTISPECIES: hypothetical protein [Actinomadura]|uniref:hypothetical protein n=1 Tax=Actinomadura TaxID=1988 RepID=UPI001485EFAD|nr:hypothetical protein [Actinomadura geliboluensis]
MVKHVALPVGPLLDGSLGDDPLALEPAALQGGILIGYARVSTDGLRRAVPA